MTKQEFLNEITGRRAIMLPPASARALELANGALQQMRAAMMPMWFIDLLQTAADGIMLGDADIFGITKTERTHAGYEMPDIMSINRNISHIGGMRGRTVFGRNALFWFGFDAFGRVYMLDNLNASPVREYSDPYKAMFDCLVVGKV